MQQTVKGSTTNLTRCTPIVFPHDITLRTSTLTSTAQTTLTHASHIIDQTATLDCKF